MNKDQVKDLFIGMGFVLHTQPVQYPYVHRALYALRLTTTPPCKLNGKLFFHASHHVLNTNGSEWGSIEFDITAETEDSKWFKLMCYAVPAEDLTEEGVDNIKARLVRAWGAVQ